MIIGNVEKIRETLPIKLQCSTYYKILLTNIKSLVHFIYKNRLLGTFIYITFSKNWITSPQTLSNWIIRFYSNIFLFSINPHFNSSLNTNLSTSHKLFLFTFKFFNIFTTYFSNFKIYLTTSFYITYCFITYFQYKFNFIL